MKHSKLVIILSLLLVSNVFVSSNSLNSKSTADSGCEDSCTACQKAVYQLKFQGTADCNDGVCSDTCYKIKESWTSPFNPFVSFIKDMFGKCEICFRVGHCTISQCKDQQRNESEVINKVINSSHLTAKISQDLLPSSNEQIDPKALPHIVKLNNKVGISLKHEIKTAVKLGTTQNLIKKVQSLVKTYFDKPTGAVTGTPYVVLNASNVQPVSSANISYWTENSKVASTQITQAKKAIGDLDKQIENIKSLKSSGKGDNKDLKKVVKEEKKEIKKLIKKTNKINKDLTKKEKVLIKLVDSPKVQDSNVKTALRETLNQINEYKKSVKSVTSELKRQQKAIKP